MAVKYISILNANNDTLLQISKERLLALNIEEMETIKKYFQILKREPTDCELETLAQTWSEHCKHKTFTAKIEYSWEPSSRITTDEVRSKTVKNRKTKNYNNLLKETIFKATKELNKKWCISVFEDNAGIIEFDKENAVAFKVETHNHPSAIEPYGGAGTGIGGVIRDILGCGLGAKPIMNTDIFCFGNLDYPLTNLPEGVLHPKRVFTGVVSGVRDYGNKMGIPTANGSIIFDDGYLYNPIVYCGTVGILPKNKIVKKIISGDLILAVGGRTGRDGIHGATFSSTSLDKNVPSSVVQIGNPIVEKKLADTILQARDKNLYRAITDCGAGGFSSAVGELATFSNGATVYLDKAPLKYEGLEPWEIWVSEAQERMVLAVPKKNIKKILKIFSDEDVEATILGEFTNSGKLEGFYKNDKVLDLDMNFLHDGLPKKKMVAVWKDQAKKSFHVCKNIYGRAQVRKPLDVLKKLLSSLNICSKEWVVRQYDHEVQAKTIIKPLVGKNNDGPSDAAVIKPIPDSYKGIAVSNGINLYGKIDPYKMAICAIDEALRNVVCVGGDLTRTAILDNFCWGDTEKPEHLGALVRASEGCYDAAKAFSTPFISGKDSFNNKYLLDSGKTISIPHTLLISAISVVKDIRKCMTLDLKTSDNLIYIVGATDDEYPPKIVLKNSKKQMLAMQKAIEQETVASCHDCSDGGIAVCITEMCFSGGLGAEIDLKKVPYHHIDTLSHQYIDNLLLFSESSSRFIVEVKKEKELQFQRIFKGNNFSKIGVVSKKPRLTIKNIKGEIIIDADSFELKNCWQKTIYV
ncbi:MAG: phosphoribosylformylglycinamidine synthase subunit PurL [Elusimicrobiota bacterium]